MHYTVNLGHCTPPVASNVVGSIAAWHLRFNTTVAHPTEFSAGSLGFDPQENGALDGFPVVSDGMENLKIGAEIVDAVPVPQVVRFQKQNVKLMGCSCAIVCARQLHMRPSEFARNASDRSWGFGLRLVYTRTF